MQVSESLSCKTTSKGKRTFVKNRESINSGFVEGAKYRLIDKGDHVEVILDKNGDRTVAKGNIVDLQNHTMTKVFSDVDRVNVSYLEERIILTAHYSEQQINEREKSIKTGQRIRIGEIFAGTGNLGLQIKKGLSRAGVDASVKFAVERCQDKAYVLSSEKSLWEDSDSQIFIDDIMKMDLSLLTKVDVLLISYPCVGFSMMQTNKSKRDIRHPDAGVLFVKLLEIISRTNPSTIVIENSPQMRNTDTLYIMDTVLETTGYKHSEGTLKGTDFGDFEPRERMIKVYTSIGLTPFNVEDIKPTLSFKKTVADIIEASTVRPTDWKEYGYLRNHAKSKKQGHGFFAAKPSDNKLKTLGANYAKAQPDTSFLQHPSNDELFRMFTPQEHANIRRFTHGMKEAINESAEGKGQFYQRGNRSRAHKMSGDSISPLPWLHAGLYLGRWLIENRTYSKQQAVNTVQHVA